MKLNHKKINQELERLGWTRTEYARRMGVSKQLASYYLNRGKGFRIIEILAKPLNLDPRDLLSR
jgi:transcriptional regulator with XRE-family HTH domain